MVTPTRLGSKLAAGATPLPAATSVSALGKRAAVAGRRSETVDLPELGRIRFELPGALAFIEIESEVLAALRARGLDLSIGTAGTAELDKAIRTLAVACRDPETGAPFGTLAEWGDLPVDVVNVAWQAYGDVRERLDPMSLPLSEEERIEIDLAVKKKDARLLRTYGVVRLSAWLATTADPPSTSPSPSSSSLESSTDV